jgi:hypothetical protein
MSDDELARYPDLYGEESESVPWVVTAARWLFVVLGVIWVAFGISSLLRLESASRNVPLALLLIITLLMFVNALLLILVGWCIGRGNWLYFYFGLLLLAGNIFLTFTDEFGLFDLLTLIINVLLLVILIIWHSKFIKN